MLETSDSTIQNKEPVLQDAIGLESTETTKKAQYKREVKKLNIISLIVFCLLFLPFIVPIITKQPLAPEGGFGSIIIIFWWSAVWIGVLIFLLRKVNKLKGLHKINIQTQPRPVRLINLAKYSFAISVVSFVAFSFIGPNYNQSPLVYFGSGFIALCSFFLTFLFWFLHAVRN